MTAHPDDADLPAAGQPALPPPTGHAPETGPGPSVARQPGVRQSTAGVPYRSFGHLAPDGAGATARPCPAVKAPAAAETQPSGTLDAGAATAGAAPPLSGRSAPLADEASSPHDGQPFGSASDTAHAAGAHADGAFVPPEPALRGTSRERRLKLTLMLCGAAVTVGMGVAIALLMEGASPPLRLGGSGGGAGSNAPAHVSSGASGALDGASGGGAAMPGDPACPLAGGASGCPAMVPVPAGRYRIGTVRSDPDAQDEELGGTEQAIAAFELSSHEVTAGQWQLCVNDGACPPPLQAASAAAMPVTGVSWEAAVAYAAWLSDKTGRRYRLPTEAEWEYAARGGAATPFPWGERLGQRHAHCGQCGTLDWYPRFAPVGSFAPHQGLYDMVGNAYEWVADCWRPNHAQPPQAACRDKVQKGGAFDTLETGVRPVARTYGDRSVADVRVGFRVARDAQPAAPAHTSLPTIPRTER